MAENARTYVNPKAKQWVAGILTRMIPEPGSECIRWVGYINTKNGYGQARISTYFDWMGSVKVTGAHRLVYTLIRGPIPKGHHIDHRCSEVSNSLTENRWCVNPYHLEAMSQPENAYLANRRRWHDDRSPVPDGHFDPHPEFAEALDNPVSF